MGVYGIGNVGAKEEPPKREPLVESAIPLYGGRNASSQLRHLLRHPRGLVTKQRLLTGRIERAISKKQSAKYPIYILVQVIEGLNTM